MKNNVKPIPDGFRTVTPYLVVQDAAQELAFMQQAFGGSELYRSTGPDGNIMHAEAKIGDSIIMIGQAREPWKPRPSTIYLYVEDVDGVFQRAVQAGAKSLMEPKDQFYGDRSGGVEDANGIQWFIATHVEDVSHEEIQRRFAAMGHQH